MNSQTFPVGCRYLKTGSEKGEGHEVWFALSTGSCAMNIPTVTGNRKRGAQFFSVGGASHLRTSVT